MNFYRTHLGDDISNLTLTLSYNENLTALRCAQKVKSHLQRHLESGNLKYQRNLEVIEEVIALHKRQLEDLGGPLGILKAS